VIDLVAIQPQLPALAAGEQCWAPSIPSATW
jgi:hypothetical protein